MKQNWEFWMVSGTDTVASFFSNLALASQAPDKRRPWRMKFTLRMRRPRNDGLSSSEEFDQLVQVEDSAAQAFEKALDAIYVGRVTEGGNRIFFYYAPAASVFEAQAQRMMKAFPEYEFETEAVLDPGWRFYFENLTPSDGIMQAIKNRHVLEVMEKRGDAGTVRRDVRHWAYFSLREHRSGYRRAIEDMGFTFVSDSTVDGELRFGVSFEREDSLASQEFDDVTIQLMELANEFEGEYDGWESPLLPGGEEGATSDG